MRFYHVVEGSLVHFGIPGKPRDWEKWRHQTMKDDPVKESNRRGYLSFESTGDNSRATKMIINLDDNPNLDAMGYAPFAKVVEGMDIIDEFHSGYGHGPDVKRVESEGNKYLKKEFLDLSYIRQVQRVASTPVGDEL
jgi:peptidyl-prolyl cis-trans isomerase A (cyclophilin A)